MNLENPSGKGLIINSKQLKGSQQMAADVLMLKQISSKEEFSISVRFYQWEKACLSIGHNQKHLPEKWIQLFKEKKLNIVRRPSGGNAVLHSGGLTYSLAWRSPPRKKLQAYLIANQWLIEAFSECGFKLNFGNNKSNSIPQNCFASSTHADLIDINGEKCIGSAQFWKQGNMLQHGEIILDPPKELWSEVFGTNPPQGLPSYIPRENLDQILTNYLTNYWSNIAWETKGFTFSEILKIKKDALNYSFHPK